MAGDEFNKHMEEIGDAHDRIERARQEAVPAAFPEGDPRLLKDTILGFPAALFADVSRRLGEADPFSRARARSTQRRHSGKRNDRPELAAALAACKKHKAKLIIAKLDRLSRNLAFIATLMDSGVEFVAVDNPVANKLTIHILAAVAQHEREIISARTSAAALKPFREERPAPYLAAGLSSLNPTL
jgi:hypothetical protein